MRLYRETEQIKHVCVCRIRNWHMQYAALEAGGFKICDVGQHTDRTSRRKFKIHHHFKVFKYYTM